MIVVLQIQLESLPGVSPDSYTGREIGAISSRRASSEPIAFRSTYSTIAALAAIVSRERSIPVFELRRVLAATEPAVLITPAGPVICQGVLRSYEVGETTSCCC
jgi:hypothetical protein